MPFDNVLNMSDKIDLFLDPYPVGDLVSKLSNFGPENIIHKDKINYDKNKNLKLSNFFINKKEDCKDIREERNTNNSEKLEELNYTENKKFKSKISEKKNVEDIETLSTDNLENSLKYERIAKNENNETSKEKQELNHLENKKDVISSPKNSNISITTEITENLLNKTKQINLFNYNINESQINDEKDRISQNEKNIEKNSKINNIQEKDTFIEKTYNKENKSQHKRKSDSSPDTVLSNKHKKFKKESLSKNTKILEKFLNIKKTDPEK